MTEHEITNNNLAVAMMKLEAAEKLVADLTLTETGLEHSYARLGYLLTEISEKRYWQEANLKSFGQYIKSLSEKYNRGRTQLYHYFSTVKQLKSYVNEEQLNKMGIAKASEIRKAVKKIGQAPKPEIIEAALTPTVTAAMLRKMIFETYNMPADEKGTWMDFQGFYVTEDEKKIIDEAFESALRTDPAVKKETADWIKRKEFILRLSMNYLAHPPENIFQ